MEGLSNLLIQEVHLDQQALDNLKNKKQNAFEAERLLTRAGNSLDETISCARAFKELKALVSTWSSDLALSSAKQTPKFNRQNSSNMDSQNSQGSLQSQSIRRSVAPSEVLINSFYRFYLFLYFNQT